MSSFTITRPDVWGNIVGVKMKLGSGTVGGDTYSIGIPGGYWQICNVFGVKDSNAAVGGDALYLGVATTGTVDTYNLVASSTMAANMSFAGTQTQTWHSGSLNVSPGQSLVAMVVNAGAGNGGYGCELFVQMLQRNPGV